MNKPIAIAASAVLLVAGFVLLTGFGGGGWCNGHGHGRGHGRDPAAMAAFVTARVDDALDDIDATPEQRERIHAIKDRMVEAAKKAHLSKGDAHETLLAEWKSEKPDAQKLHALVDERLDAMRALAHQAVDSGVEAHDVLTPEQRAKVTRKIERWHR